MRLSEAIESCCRTREAWITGSGARAARNNVRHALRIIGDISVYEIKTHHFKEIVTTLTGEGYSASTINQVLTAVCTVLSELKECGDEQIIIPSFKRPRIRNTKLEFYSDEEINSLLEDSLKEDDYCLLHDSILFAYKTGCRQEEMLLLTMDAIDWTNNQLTFFDTKNGDDHTIHLHGDLLEILKRRADYRIDDRLFPWEGALHGANKLRRTFKKVRDRLGIEDRKLWHTIRHTTATHLVSRGAKLRVVMGVLNHRNVNTTLRYAKVADQSKKEALELL